MRDGTGMRKTAGVLDRMGRLAKAFSVAGECGRAWLSEGALKGFEQRHGMPLVFLEITPAAIHAMAWGSSGPFEN